MGMLKIGTAGNLFLNTDKINESIKMYFRVNHMKEDDLEFRIIDVETDIIFQYFYKVELRGIL